MTLSSYGLLFAGLGELIPLVCVCREDIRRSVCVFVCVLPEGNKHSLLDGQKASRTVMKVMLCVAVVHGLTKTHIFFMNCVVCGGEDLLSLIVPVDSEISEDYSQLPHSRMCSCRLP